MIKKYFLTIILSILSFQTLVKAENVKDFQIEGMSVGDSLLDYMSKKLIVEEINNKDITYYYKDDYVSISTFVMRDNYEIYDDVGVVFDPKDKNYTIVALEGTLEFEGENLNINDCYKKQDQIFDDIKSSLKSAVQEDEWFTPKERLRSHQLSIKNKDLALGDIYKNGSIRTTCYEIKRDNKSYNLLYVSLVSPEFNKYIDSL
tara:strand:+ start:92 stop:700 length:609 start_codon:yes stop_codon:yes gene_type:complete